MGCRCEHKKLASELDRVRRLAKAFARIERVTTVIFQQSDGTYSFSAIGNEQGEIVEYITEY